MTKLLAMLFDFHYISFGHVTVDDTESIHTLTRDGIPAQNS